MCILEEEVPEVARRVAKRRKRGLTPEAARGLLVLGVLGICVYVALATPVGTFIAERVIAPIFRKSEAASENEAGGQSTPIVQEVDEPSSTPGSASGNSFALLPETTGGGGEGQTASAGESGELELQVSAQTYYAIQLGAFSSQENAEVEGERMRARGAGGFVYHSDGHYRVLAAIYETQEEARSVKTQLKEQNGQDAGIYVISLPALALRVTAGKDQLSAVKTGFDSLASQCGQILALCEKFDRGEITEQDARAALGDYAKTLRGPLGQLEGAKDAIGSALCETLTACAGELERTAAAQTGTSVEFSAKLKYAHLKEVCSYASLLQKITAG